MLSVCPHPQPCLAWSGNRPVHSVLSAFWSQGLFLICIDLKVFIYNGIWNGIRSIFNHLYACFWLDEWKGLWILWKICFALHTKQSSLLLTVACAALKISKSVMSWRHQILLLHHSYSRCVQYINAEMPGKKKYVCLLKLMEFGFFSLCCCCNCGALFFRSRWSIQIDRRHTSAGTCGLQRDFCGSYLSTGWNGSYSKPFHSAARWLMLPLDCFWRRQGCKSSEKTISVWEASCFGGGVCMCIC